MKKIAAIRLYCYWICLSIFIVPLSVSIIQKLDWDTGTGHNLQNIYFFFLFSKSLFLSLLTAKHQSRDNLKTSEIFGLWAGIRRSFWRFREVQSSTNCVNWRGVGGQVRMLQVGCTAAMVFRKSGYILLLTSAVAEQAARTWSVDSTGALHRRHFGSMFGWSMDS